MNRFRGGSEHRDRDGHALQMQTKEVLSKLLKASCQSKFSSKFEPPYVGGYWF